MMNKRYKEILSTIASIFIVDIFFTFEFLFIYIAIRICSHHPMGFFVMMLINFLFVEWIATKIFMKSNRGDENVGNKIKKRESSRRI